MQVNTLNECKPYWQSSALGVLSLSLGFSKSSCEIYLCDGDLCIGFNLWKCKTCFKIYLCIYKIYILSIYITSIICSYIMHFLFFLIFILASCWVQHIVVGRGYLEYTFLSSRHSVLSYVTSTDMESAYAP